MNFLHTVHKRKKKEKERDEYNYFKENNLQVNINHLLYLFYFIYLFLLIVDVRKEKKREWRKKRMGEKGETLNYYRYQRERESRTNLFPPSFYSKFGGKSQNFRSAKLGSHEPYNPNWKTAHYFRIRFPSNRIAPAIKRIFFFNFLFRSLKLQVFFLCKFFFFRFSSSSTWCQREK